VDAFSTAVIGLGIGLSPYVDLGLALGLVVVYLALSINVYLESSVFGVVKISYSRIGPTEVRLLLVLVNTVLALAARWHLKGLWPIGRIGNWALAAVLAACLSLLVARPLNVLAAGELRARSVGLQIEVWRTILFVACATLTAIAVINAGTVGRLVNDPLGTVRTPVLYTSSSTAYNPRDSGGNPISRWGDYSYTCLDPDDDMTMWTIQEFCQAANSYAVQVVKLLAPPPATPTNCAPASVNAGANNVNVAVSASSNGDTGFFDPGVGFSNRLSAAVNGGGVTINNIIYTDPRHVTLNVSVAAGATAGGRTITVTNPDGQSATSASALLTIVAVSNSSPVANFIGAPTMGVAPLNVILVNQSTFAMNYSWDFGDSATSTATNPAHLYTNAGIYSVALSASGPGGSSNFTRTNYIVVTNALPPVADFVAAPTNGFGPLTVNFTNLSSLATNYAWDFGDGEIGKYADVVAVDEDLADFLVQTDSADLLQVCVGALDFTDGALVREVIVQVGAGSVDVERVEGFRIPFVGLYARRIGKGHIQLR